MLSAGRHSRTAVEEHPPVAERRARSIIHPLRSAARVHSRAMTRDCLVSRDDPGFAAVDRAQPCVELRAMGVGHPDGVGCTAQGCPRARRSTRVAPPAGCCLCQWPGDLLADDTAVRPVDGPPAAHGRAPAIFAPRWGSLRRRLGESRCLPTARWRSAIAPSSVALVVTLGQTLPGHLQGLQLTGDARRSR